MSDGIQIKFDLHAAQMQVFQDRTRYRLIAAGRRFGKSHLAIAEAGCAALDPANLLRQPVFLIAPTQPQAKLIYWRPLIEKLSPVITSTNVNEGLITLQSGVLVGVKGADNPDAMRGTGLWFAALDEYASMKPYVWPEIIRPALVDSCGRALFIGTPSGRNHFYDLFEMAKMELDPEWKAWHFESVENPYLPTGEVEAARRSMSAAAFNREFRASFATGSGDSFKAEHLKFDGVEPKNGQWFVAVDLAGFADIEKAATSKQLLLDEHVIVTAKVTPDDAWYVKDIAHGRWGIKETAKRIVDALVDAEPTAWGIERGALYNAVMPYIMDEARRRNIMPPSPVPLSHENRVKNERIIWALQGRLEHGRVSFAKAAWNREVEDQMTQFPSKMVHDDIPDALSYVAQLSQGRVLQEFADIADEPYWRPVDEDIGL